MSGDDKYFQHIDAACDTVLAPFKAWARVGFADGALDFWPSHVLARPPVISARVLNEVWEAALSGFEPDAMSEDDRAEASARFEFVHALLNRLMTRESEIRDEYHRGRRRGVVSRTAVLAAALVCWTVLAISAPLWITAPATFLGGIWIGARARRLYEIRSRVRPVRNATPLILAVLPWASAGVADRA